MKLSGHAVELVGELFQFVVGLDFDTVFEVAVAEALRACVESLDRHQHAPRQQHAGEDRDRKTECDEECRCVSGDRGSAPTPDLWAVRTARTSRAWGPGSMRSVPPGLQCSFRMRATSLPDFSKAAIWGSADSVLPVCMVLSELASRMPCGIHDIRRADLADLRIIDKPRQKAKIDLRDGRSGVLPGMSDGDRHERDFVAEESGGIYDALGDGLAESHIAGEVGATGERDRVTRQRGAVRGPRRRAGRSG